jgi:hypothetical protein
MKLTVKKVDRRHNAFGLYSHFLEIYNHNADNIKIFIEIRNWLWEIFGPSYELKFVDKDIANPPSWSWDSDGYVSRIYFATEKERATFSLKFGY